MTTLHIVLIIVGLLILVGGGVVLALRGRGATETSRYQAGSTNPADYTIDQGYTDPVPLSDDETDPQTNESELVWQATETEWTPIGTPPACPNPLILEPPVKLESVTSILYPGQTRGGNYKPHGGFRFDTMKDNQVAVTMPMDTLVVRGSRFLVNGEIQYGFDFINNCGIMHRLGHLLELTPSFQAIAETFPAAQEGDSRTEYVNPPIAVKAGEVIATKIGVTKGEEGVNTFMDWGVYDLRERNEASQNAAYAASHSVELDQHAVCWFDLLSAANEAQVRSLPAGDPTSGKTSDYCK